MSSFLRNIPNILTVSRIILAPIFFILFIYNYYYLALILFFFASVTDFLDGFLARKFNIISKFGKMYDPLADKILVFLGWLCFIIKPPYIIIDDKFNSTYSISIILSNYTNINPNYIIFSILVILLLRDLIVTTLREEKYKKESIILKTNYIGKIKTTVFIICIHLYLIYQLIPIEYLVNNNINISLSFFESSLFYLNTYIFWIYDFTLYLTLVLSLLSLYDYIYQYKDKKI